MRADTGSVFHLYCSKMGAGGYEPPERLPFSNLSFGDFNPAVSVDEKFLIFSSRRAPAPGVTDLFIVYREGAGGSEPKDLRVLSSEVHGVEAKLSPDNKTLYFSNSKDGNLYIWKEDISSYAR